MSETENNNRSNFYSGASGLVLPVPNKSLYPPEFQHKPRLTYYGSLFNSIEINSSFYRLPQASTVKKWTNEVPAHFKFTYKLWRDITHNKQLLFNPKDVERFMQVIDAAGDHKGSLLVQFPGSIDVSNIRQLEKLLVNIQDTGLATGWDIAIEFRNSSWYKDEVYEMLDNYSAGMVLQDMPKSLTPIVDMATEFVYLRFHGPNGGYRGSYTDAFLYEYAQYINEWLADGKKVYAYFNNTMGDAVNNLITLNSYVV